LKRRGRSRRRARPVRAKAVAAFFGLPRARDRPQSRPSSARHIRSGPGQTRRRRTALDAAFRGCGRPRDSPHVQSTAHSVGGISVTSVTPRVEGALPSITPAVSRTRRAYASCIQIIRSGCACRRRHRDAVGERRRRATRERRSGARPQRGRQSRQTDHPGAWRWTDDPETVIKPWSRRTLAPATCGARECTRAPA
jgi:hypothetical protein